MSTEPKTIPEVIHELAASYRKDLTEFETKAYIKMLSQYDFGLVLRSAFDYVNNEEFLSPAKLKKTIETIQSKDYYAAQRSLPRLPESEADDEDRAFGSFVCKAMSGWLQSDFIKQQREAGTFIDYDHSLFAYMAKQKMEQKHIDRLAGTYPRDPRSTQ